MSGSLMQRENAALSERVTDLSMSQSLSRCSRAGCREDERDRGAPGSRSSQRSIRKRWSWNDRSGNGRTTVRRCNKPDVMGLSAEDLR